MQTITLDFTNSSLPSLVAHHNNFTRPKTPLKPITATRLATDPFQTKESRWEISQLQFLELFHGRDVGLRTRLRHAALGVPESEVSYDFKTEDSEYENDDKVYLPSLDELDEGLKKRFEYLKEIAFLLFDQREDVPKSPETRNESANTFRTPTRKSLEVVFKNGYIHPKRHRPLSRELLDFVKSMFTQHQNISQLPRKKQTVLKLRMPKSLVNAMHDASNLVLIDGGVGGKLSLHKLKTLYPNPKMPTKKYLRPNSKPPLLPPRKIQPKPVHVQETMVDKQVEEHICTSHGLQAFKCIGHIFPLDYFLDHEYVTKRVNLVSKSPQRCQVENMICLALEYNYSLNQFLIEFPQRIRNTPKCYIRQPSPNTKWVSMNEIEWVDEPVNKLAHENYSAEKIRTAFEIECVYNQMTGIVMETLYPEEKKLDGSQNLTLGLEFLKKWCSIKASILENTKMNQLIPRLKESVQEYIKLPMKKKLTLDMTNYVIRQTKINFIASCVVLRYSDLLGHYNTKIFEDSFRAYTIMDSKDYLHLFDELQKRVTVEQHDVVVASYSRYHNLQFFMSMIRVVRDGLVLVNLPATYSENVTYEYEIRVLGKKLRKKFSKVSKHFGFLESIIDEMIDDCVASVVAFMDDRQNLLDTWQEMFYELHRQYREVDIVLQKGVKELIGNQNSQEFENIPQNNKQQSTSQIIAKCILDISELFRKSYDCLELIIEKSMYTFSSHKDSYIRSWVIITNSDKANCEYLNSWIDSCRYELGSYVREVFGLLSGVFDEQIFEALRNLRKTLNDLYIQVDYLDQEF